MNLRIDNARSKYAGELLCKHLATPFSNPCGYHQPEPLQSGQSAVCSLMLSVSFVWKFLPSAFAVSYQLPEPAS